MWVDYARRALGRSRDARIAIRRTLSWRRVFSDQAGGDRKAAAAPASGVHQDGRIPKAPSPPRRVTLAQIRKWYVEKRPIVMLTAYDYPAAVHADLAGIDIVLVGDSVGMVELGYDTTQYVSMDDMIHHCRAVHTGARRPYIVGDMPFGSYEVSAERAMDNAFRFIQAGKVNAVKLEGGIRSAHTVHRIVQSGVAVMGHTGLTPQSVSAIGSFRPMGQTFDEARQILQDCLALQEAGAFAIVLECIPERLAAQITSALSIPTIGIGAGRHTSGQVLVYHDLVGMLTHPHHAKVVPKFCKRYARVGEYVNNALEQYRDEVRSRTFPDDAYSPYSIADDEFERFREYAESVAKKSNSPITESSTAQGQAPPDSIQPEEKIY
ncbi:3-methyl-2-oxobutanoate hydroxymethyltransferase 2, mitochondrial [Porphyridium purpureum]|uniref:3-methyl-2-oxobutanoate hydroxymethyltransferase n=1 Tax=Porphyridium purpureum TaxID=35688 RepID=A0A5J4YRL6_PORPP|nr:3-methyl-2-oxobutanoate hydroxymethyltransferase 2, mitochondrial [Porphyridium purpureum]|eukprot:POR0355..scf229_5